MKRNGGMLAVVIAVLLGATPGSAAPVVDPASWRPVEVVDGVQVFAAEPPGEFWGLARGRVAAPADAIFHRLSNFEALPTMYPWLATVRVLERGDASCLVYFRYDLPWPLSDRCFTGLHRWWTEPSGTIVLTVEGAGGAPPEDGVVRIEDLLIRMTFAPVDDGSATDVAYLFRADLAGLLPRRVRAETAWKIPMNVILSLRRSLEPRYAHR